MVLPKGNSQKTRNIQRAIFFLSIRLKAFDLPFALTNGGPGYATTMITQIYDGATVIKLSTVKIASLFSMKELAFLGEVQGRGLISKPSSFNLRTSLC